MTDAARLTAADDLARLTRLAESADFKWWREQTLQKALVEADGHLRDVATEKDYREVAAHIHAALTEIDSFITKQIAVKRRALEK